MSGGIGLVEGSPQKPAALPKEYFPVKIHAIPVIDGTLIKSEYDVVQALTPSTGIISNKTPKTGLSCALVNDYDIGWY